ncbi:hypothetical protein HYX12_03265 [Candidatus Woesearchaeota archaeon]|nr:hypothetical protein [Candidatus Woesearchaeota archaeon]
MPLEIIHSKQQTTIRYAPNLIVPGNTQLGEGHQNIHIHEKAVEYFFSVMSKEPKVAPYLPLGKARDYSDRCHFFDPCLPLGTWITFDEGNGVNRFYVVQAFSKEPGEQETTKRVISLASLVQDQSKKKYGLEPTPHNPFAKSANVEELNLTTRLAYQLTAAGSRWQPSFLQWLLEQIGLETISTNVQEGSLIVDMHPTELQYGPNDHNNNTQILATVYNPTQSRVRAAVDKFKAICHYLFEKNRHNIKNVYGLYQTVAAIDRASESIDASTLSSANRLQFHSSLNDLITIGEEKQRKAIRALRDGLDEVITGLILEY